MIPSPNAAAVPARGAARRARTGIDGTEAWSAARRWLRHGWRSVAGLALTALLGATAPAAAQAVSLTGLEQSRSLAGELDLLEDPSGRADVQQVRQRQEGWTRVTGSALSLGFSSSTWWLRLHLQK